MSVSESHIGKVRNYIKNQEQRHSEKDFDNEIDDFMKKYDWKYEKGK